MTKLIVRIALVLAVTGACNAALFASAQAGSRPCMISGALCGLRH